MTKIKKYRCDVCGKETDNYHQEGWLRVGNLELGRGIIKNSVGVMREDPFDFCSFQCLQDHLKKGE